MSDKKAEAVSLEDFIAAATRGALRALASEGAQSPGLTAELNPQPLPPGLTAELNPQPLPPGAELARLPGGGIFVGIIQAPRASAE